MTGPETGPELGQARLPPLRGEDLPAVLRAGCASKLDAVSARVALVRRQEALIAADQGDHELAEGRVERSNHGAVPGCKVGGGRSDPLLRFRSARVLAYREYSGAI